MDEIVNDLEVLTESLQKINKDLESRKRLKDQLVGKLDTLMERLNTDFGLTSVEVAHGEIAILKANIASLAIDCNDKLTNLKESIRKFDERVAKVD